MKKVWIAISKCFSKVMASLSTKYQFSYTKFNNKKIRGDKEIILVIGGSHRSLKSLYSHPSKNK